MIKVSHDTRLSDILTNQKTDLFESKDFNQTVN
jgi:hypothetical protein